MARKDVLASGVARTAKFVGGVGEGENLKKVSDEPRMEFVPEASAAPKRKAFRPAGDVLLIRRNETAVSPLLEGVESVEKEQPNNGLVLSIGPLVRRFSLGETVVFGKYAGTILKLNGEDLIMAHEEEMLGTIEEEEISLDGRLNIGVCSSEYGINGNEREIDAERQTLPQTRRFQAWEKVL
jgi:chaperonin GroES